MYEAIKVVRQQLAMKLIESDKYVPKKLVSNPTHEFDRMHHYAK